jgi:hypothetical protein
MFDGSLHFFGCWYKDPDSPSDYIQLLDDQLIKIGGLNNTTKSPNIHLMGDFNNFPAIDWNENPGPNSKHICQSGGQAFIDILNDHHMEQMVNFPTRDNSTLDLIVTTLPEKIREAYSPDQLSDHEIVSCHLIIRTKHVQTIKRKCYLYNKDDYDKMRDDTKLFSKERYFNGQQNTRNTEDNWKMIKTFMQQAVEKHVPSKICKGK